MTPKVAQQVEALGDMTIAELRERYAEVFGEVTRSSHKDFLRKRIAWRMQANEEGGLSARALSRAKELANDADLRLLAPAARTVVRPFPCSAITPFAKISAQCSLRRQSPAARSFA
jgi:hypothetical protein